MSKGSRKSPVKPLVKISRRPPKAVREALCEEVGFRCPVEGCGSPYLTFHHFGPPWRVKNHHNPSGMVALCLNHAGKADNGYYPDEYFGRLKSEGLGLSKAVQGEFDYLRRNVLAVVGAGLYYETDTILEINGERCIYFNRDQDGYLLLNLKLPTAAGEPRAWMEDNVWTVPPGAKDIECPPRGRFLSVKFENGDSFRIEFSDLDTIEHLQKKYPKAELGALTEYLSFPLTVAEFWEHSDSAAIELGRTLTTLPGNNTVSGFVSIRNRVGIRIDVPQPRLFGSESQRVSREIIRRALDEYNRR